MEDPHRLVSIEKPLLMLPFSTQWPWEPCVPIAIWVMVGQANRNASVSLRVKSTHDACRATPQHFLGNAFRPMKPTEAVVHVHAHCILDTRTA